MRTLPSLLLLAFASCVAASSQPPPPPAPELPWLKDALIGFEPGPFAPEETPGETWYHRNALQINGSEISLYKAPVYCRDGELFSSESDGGFFWYSGTISGQTVTLTFVRCDYCAKPKDKSSSFFRSTVPIQFPSPGTVKLGNVLYRKAPSDACPVDHDV